MMKVQNRLLRGEGSRGGGSRGAGSSNTEQSSGTRVKGTQGTPARAPPDRATRAEIENLEVLRDQLLKARDEIKKSYLPKAAKYQADLKNLLELSRVDAQLYALKNK